MRPSFKCSVVGEDFEEYQYDEYFYVSNFSVPFQGAVENVLERSTHLQLSDGTVEEMTDEARNALLAKLHGLSKKALRCLGLAYKYDLAELSTYDGESHSAHKLLLDLNNYDQIESGLIFVGMAGLRVTTPHIVFF